jgi:AcrR family transcriptional regulator
MSQRARLLAAMTYVAARHGYARASVARVIERAGVSRATFYEHFGSREDCFVAAYRTIAGRVRSRLGRAAAAVPAGDRRRAVLAALLADAAANPDAAKLALIEALGGPERVRVEHERFVRESERWVERRLQLDAGPVLQIPTTALLGAIVGVVSTRLLNGEAESLPRMLDPMLGWVARYELGAGGRRWPQDAWRELGYPFATDPPSDEVAGQPLLPRGPSALADASAAATRRDRIVAAIARLAVAKGYRSLTVDDVVAAARVSRRAFYACFGGKEDAFLAAQAAALQGSIAAAAAEFSLAPSWPEQVWRAGAAMLSYVGAHPDLAHLGTVELYAVGEAAVRRTEDSRMAYGLFLEQGYADHGFEQGDRELCTEAISGAVFALIRRQVIDGRATEVLSVLPQAAYLILAPFLGPKGAMDFVVARALTARSAPRRAPARSPALVDRG